ncbi:MAG: helix-turn-helix transcriptional regulator [Lachnospiraceae bacterium]|nr:helix-turn-helix transcriptional regulator [Lachnospiraceae bacterium]
MSEYKYFDFLPKTPAETSNIIAGRIRAIRKRRKISQAELSAKSGVSLGSLKRFERTGEISLISLIKIALALDISKDFNNLFAEIPYLSMKELLNDKG